MDARQNSAFPFLEGKKQFTVPIYQRNYSWNHEQCEQLWIDIVQAGANNRIKGHFVGSIVFIQNGLYHPNSSIPLLVIDGQQRLTTLSLLLIALAKATKNSSLPLDFSHDQIYGLYLTNPFNKGEEYYKLLLSQGDKDTFIQLIDDPERAKSELPANRLLENYIYFENRLRQGDVDLNTIYTGISKLIIVDITLDKDHDNPQLIFESLNSTGMDLSQADLIRNYVLMGLDNDEQTKLYNKYWYPMEQSFSHSSDSYQFDRFMRDYLTIKLEAIPNIDKVYASFKIYQRSQVELSMQELVEDIYRYARHFINMAFEQEKDIGIKQALKDINTLKVDVAYPLLLEVYDDYANQRLSKADFIAILRLVESYVFRRVICGVPTNSMNKTFAMLAREIDKDHYLESVQAAFLEKDGTRRLPRDEEFRAAFTVKDVYNFRSRNYLLRKLEDYKHPRHLINIDSFTIEHILPQNPQLSRSWHKELGPNWKDIQARYLHTIGNLTLTGYNSELSDRPFSEKRDVKPGGFKHTPLWLNEGLVELEHWGETEIQQRAAMLANQAVHAWSIPHVSDEQISTYSKKAQKQILAEAIGPVDHPIAGFIPAGFKIAHIGSRKFYYFRLIDDEWIHYGNGKDPWFAYSWENAGRWLRDFDKKNTMPLGIGGPVHPSYGGKVEPDILIDVTDNEADLEEMEEVLS